MPLSQSPIVKLLGNVFATIWVAMGVNAMLRPQSGMEVWQFPLPTNAADRKLVDNLMIVYGTRDVFMGVAIYAAALFGIPKAMGWIMVTGGAVAFVDGAVSILQIGGGQWNDWGYAPIVTVVGALLSGVAD